MITSLSKKAESIGRLLTIIFPDPTRFFNGNRPYHPILLMLFLVPVYSFVFGYIVPLKIHWTIIVVIMALMTHLVFSYGHVWYILVLMVTIDVIVNSILMPHDLLRP